VRCAGAHSVPSALASALRVVRSQASHRRSAPFSSVYLMVFRRSHRVVDASLTDTTAGCMRAQPRTCNNTRGEARQVT